MDPFEQQLVQKVTGKMMEVVENKATPLMIDRESYLLYTEIGVIVCVIVCVSIRIVL